MSSTWCIVTPLSYKINDFTFYHLNFMTRDCLSSYQHHIHSAYTLLLDSMCFILSLSPVFMITLCLYYYCVYITTTEFNVFYTLPFTCVYDITVFILLLLNSTCFVFSLSPAFIISLSLYITNTEFNVFRPQQELCVVHLGFHLCNVCCGCSGVLGSTLHSDGCESATSPQC